MSSSSLLSPLLLLQPLNPKTPSSPLTTTLFPSTTCSLFSPTRFSRFSISPSPFSLSQSLHHYQHQDEYEEDDPDDELVIGDCLVFEEGIFEDPILQNPDKPLTKITHLVKPQIQPQDLIPDDWKQAQQAYNITKQERRKLAQQLQFGRKLQNRKDLLKPIQTNDQLENEYVVYRNAKLAQLRPVVLDNPTFSDNDNVGDKSSDDENVRDNGLVVKAGRAKPRNPRLDVYRGSLDDVSEFLKSGDYDPDSAPKNSDGPRKLFTREEKVLLNRRVPDLECATSGKWQPLHTFAASGEFYLLTELLKHNVDINVSDKTGLTAIHKAILGKKQAIFNILLRESANPFVRDEEGATLMHYAVRTASSQMIKILLLYNVDINLQDNYGWTPLHLAVQSRRTDIVRLLLIKGADKTLKTREGLTPLELCLYCGQDTRTYELIKLIKLLPRQRSLSDRKLDSSV